MDILVVITDRNGVTLSSFTVASDDGPVFVPMPGDEVEYIDEAGRAQSGKVLGRKTGYLTNGGQLLHVVVTLVIARTRSNIDFLKSLAEQ